MVGHNERKLEVLEYLSKNSSVTSDELASALDLEIHNARTLLKNYSSQGLLSRSKVDCYGTRIYDMTEKGWKRLKWLRGDEGEEEKEIPASAVPVMEKMHPVAPPKSARAPISPYVAAAQRLRKIAEILARYEAST